MKALLSSFFSCSSNLIPSWVDGRLVAKRLLNFFDDRISQQLNLVQRPDGLINLLNFASTSDSRADIIIPQDPSISELRLRNVELLRNWLESADLLELALPLAFSKLLHHTSNEWVLRVTVPASFWNALVVFAGQDTGLEWRKNGQTSAIFLVQVVEFSLNFVSRQHRVTWLLHDWSNKTKTVGVAPGGCDLGRSPLRGSPVEGLALIDNVVECSHSLFHWGLPIWSMGVDDVDIIESQSLQCLIGTLDNMLAVQPDIVDRSVSVSGSPVDLGGNNDRVALPSEVLNGSAH